jgi:hypothetical protein
MQLQAQASPTRRSLGESRGGWAFFGRLMAWSTRNNPGSSGI